MGWAGIEILKQYKTGIPPGSLHSGLLLLLANTNCCNAPDVRQAREFSCARCVHAAEGSRLTNTEYLSDRDFEALASSISATALQQTEKYPRDSGRQKSTQEQPITEAAAAGSNKNPTARGRIQNQNNEPITEWAINKWIEKKQENRR